MPKSSYSASDTAPASSSPRLSDKIAARCGVSEDDLLTPELAATFINDETPHTRVLLNQADTAERLALGRGMAAMLRGPVCLGTFRRSG